MSMLNENASFEINIRSICGGLVNGSFIRLSVGIVKGEAGQHGHQKGLHRTAAKN